MTIITNQPLFSFSILSSSEGMLTAKTGFFPYQLIRSTGNSGYSFGVTQGDLAGNPTARAAFSQILDLAVAATDSGVITDPAFTITDSQASAILNTVKNGGTLTSDQIAQADNALSWDSGARSLVDSFDVSDSFRISGILTNFTNNLTASNSSTGFGLGVFSTSDPNYQQAMALVAAWANMMPNNDISTLTAYLEGKNNQFEKLNEAPTLADVQYYLSSQDQFTFNGEDYNNWQKNVFAGVGWYGTALQYTPDVQPAAFYEPDQYLPNGALTTIANDLQTQSGGNMPSLPFQDPTNVFTSMASTLGSAVGSIIGNNDPFESIGTSAMLGTILGDIGQAVSEDINVSYATIQGEISLALNSLPSDFLNNLESAGTGALGSFLAGDLLNALGISGVPGQFLDSVTSSTVGQIATNLFDEATEPASETANLTWDSGLTSSFFGATIGSFVGGQIGAALYSPTSIDGQEGAQIGETLGSLAGIWAAGGFSGSASTAILGSEFLTGFAFAGIGALVGFVLGGLIGDWFNDSTPQAFANINLSTAGTDPAYVLAGDYTQDGGDQDTATALGISVTTALNEILTDVGGTVTGWGQSYGGQNPIGFGIGTYTVNGTLDLTYQLHYGTQYFFNPSSTTLDQLVSFATLNQLAQLQFSGGDPYIERAIDAALRSSSTPELQTLTGDIQLAKDYENYLANEGTIDALIAADPKSAFAAGWVVEMAMFAEMGFGTSVQGGADNDSLSAITETNPDGSTTDCNVLIGGGGGDTYFVGADDGNVTILNGVSTNNIAQGILQLNETGLVWDSNVSGPGETNLTLTQQGADLVIGLPGSTQTVTLEGWFADSFAEVQQLTLHDPTTNGNTIVSLYDIQSLTGQLTTGNGEPASVTGDIGIAGSNDYVNTNNTIAGGNGDDVLIGGTGVDTFIAGGGADALYGGGGADTYQVDAAGDLTIFNNQNESGLVSNVTRSGTLQFEGLTFDQLRFSQVGNDLQVSVAGLPRPRLSTTGLPATLIN